MGKDIDNKDGQTVKHSLLTTHVLASYDSPLL